MRLSVITKYIGLSLLMVAAFMFISAAVGARYGFDDSFYPLLYSGIITGILGAFPSIFVRKAKKLSTKEGFFIVVGAWVMACLMGMLPYLLIGGDFNVVNSLFESISGFTTTGASIVSDIEALPRGILFWRMSTAWIGGIGILVLFSLIVPSSEGNDNVLAGSEISDIARSSAKMRSRPFVISMAITYVVLTVFTIIMLLFCGMGWFDATTHAMSACSTCGFSTRNASIADYSSTAVEIVLIASMALASIRFILLSQCFTRSGLKRFRHSQVTMFFLGTLVGGTILITVSLLANNAGNAGECLRMAAFQTASIFSTTGFATEDTNLWPPMAKSLIVLGSFVCGCSGSTSGGIKCDRLMSLGNSSRRRYVNCIPRTGFTA
jgi:Trk-type K+ transport systems, membrane components